MNFRLFVQTRSERTCWERRIGKRQDFKLCPCQSCCWRVDACQSNSKVGNIRGSSDSIARASAGTIDDEIGPTWPWWPWPPETAWRPCRHQKSEEKQRRRLGLHLDQSPEHCLLRPRRHQEPEQALSLHFRRQISQPRYALCCRWRELEHCSRRSTQQAGKERQFSWFWKTFTFYQVRLQCVWQRHRKVFEPISRTRRLFIDIASPSCIFFFVYLGVPWEYQRRTRSKVSCV